MSNSEQVTAREETLRNAVITMAVESWRFGRAFDRLLTKLDVVEQERHKSQLRWFVKKLEETMNLAELKFVNIEGDRFDSGTAATPLNIEDFEAQDELMVEQMLEPIIMGKDGLIKMGTVMLRKVKK
ncbi:MAG: hypothetical protein FWH52_02965 [Synergistaceae bacterium]|nr:hypothetical protein [Synergistaceae bacterium]